MPELLAALSRLERGLGRLGGRESRLGGDQLGQIPQVLGAGGEEKLVAGAAGPA